MSWKTSLFGLLALLGSTVATFFPEVARYGAALASFASAAGLLFARDNKRSDEQAGAGKRVRGQIVGKPGGTGPISSLCVACCAVLLFVAPGCAVFDGSMNEGDVALLAEDMRDLGREGTIYALTENPEHRAHIELVRDKLIEQGSRTNALTFAEFMTVLQGLPIDELKTPEARLGIVGGRAILRRVGRNVDLGNIQNIRPLAAGLGAGMDEGLATVAP